MNTDVIQELISDGYTKLCEIPYYVEAGYPEYKRYNSVLNVWFRPVDGLFAVSSVCPVGVLQREYIYCSEDRLKVCLSEFDAYMESNRDIQEFGFFEDPVQKVDKYLKLNHRTTRKQNKVHKNCSWMPVKDLDDYSDVQEFTTDVLLDEVETIFNNEGRALILDPEDYNDLDLIKTATDIVISGASSGKSKDEVIRELVDHLYDFTFPLPN